MSTIRSEIERIKNDVASAYDAVEEMDGDLPEVQNVSNLAASVRTIPKSSESVSNENLLLNWDFRNPVNRNGKTEYTVLASNTIDQWGISSNVSLTVYPGFIRYKRFETTGQPTLAQKLSNIAELSGSKVTLSILCRGAAQIRLEMHNANHTPSSLGQKVFTLTDTENWQLLTITLDSVDLVTNAVIAQFTKSNEVNAYVDIRAAKLELGSQQTLARQNEAGEWELIDPPDYDLQYALCCQYSSTTGEWIGTQHSNKNLLRNWDFRNPVNRNGETTYVGFGNMIDGWHAVSTITRLRIVDGGVTIDRDPNSTLTNTKNIGQSIYDLDSLRGKTVTFSALVSDATASPAVVFQPKEGGASLYNVSGIVSNEPQLVSTAFTIPEDAPDLEFLLRATGNTANTYTTFVAAKLELGSQQTLARQNEAGEWELIDPPDYDLQYDLTSPAMESNPNLLHNWYFPNPVNRSGLTSWVGKSSAIDCWRTVSTNQTLSLEDGGLRITRGSASGAAPGSSIALEYFIHDGLLEVGKKYTLSMLVTEVNSARIGLRAGQNALGSVGTAPGIYCGTFTMTESILSDDTHKYIGFEFRNKNIGEFAVIKAAKLEAGEYQTLARQNEAGEWELIDKPDYDKEYALTSLYRTDCSGWAGIQRSNQNLLHNWYFLNAVNTKGFATTSVSADIVDGWFGNMNTTGNNMYISYEPGVGIRIEYGANPATSSPNGITQQLPNCDLLGKTVTISVLFDNGLLRSATGIISDTENSWKISSNINNVWIGLKQNAANVVQFSCTTTLSFTIIAAKVELGPIQTLAHREGDNWVLNDPPDYDYQYMLCSLYSKAINGWMGIQHSNPNLLDNWYFLDPINQRGETTYPSAYGTIDRWLSYNAELHVESGYINVTGINDGTIFIAQKFENFKQMYGKTYTASVLLRGNSSGFRLGLYSSKATYASSTTKVTSDDWTLFSFTVTLPNYSNETYLGFIIYPDTLAEGSVDIRAAKLELGPIQTLAHREGDTWVLNDSPPNKALELAKCQRYQIVYSYLTNSSFSNATMIGFGFVQSTTTARFTISLPTILRAKPSAVCNDFYIYKPPNIRVKITATSVLWTLMQNQIGLEVTFPQTENILQGDIVFLESWGGSKLILDANL